MITEPLTVLAVIVVGAFLSQLLASRANVPSVLFLLVVGVGLSSVIDPDEVFGDLLFTGVGIGVAILLFEGGTGLHWSRLRRGKKPVIRLVTIGAIVAWAVGTMAAAAVLDVDTGIAILIGAILIVSGPTVVMPLIRVVRPRQPTSSILRWEGILIDPIGAGIAIVVLDAIIEERSLGRIGLRVITTFAAGLIVGGIFSVILILGLRHRMIADHLQIPATLAALLAAYAFSNVLRPEAGLIAATVLGMALANQRRAPAAHIAEFNENLGAIVLGVLFIVLGARVNLDAIADNLLASLAIIAALVLVARPLSVIASTLGTEIAWRDRAFLMALAPRGVVAAAVASLFALELQHHDIDPGPLVPVVFTVVVGTVTLTGFAARFAASRLRVAQPTPSGVAIVDGGLFGIELAGLLNRNGVTTIHIGLETEAAERAASSGQLVYSERLDTEEFLETVATVGVGSVLALSGRAHLDAYAVERLAGIVGSANIFGLHNPATEPEPGTAQSVVPLPVLPAGLGAEDLEELMRAGRRLRLVPPYSMRPGWHTIGRIDENQRVIFDPVTDNAVDTDRVFAFGPDIPEKEQA